MKDQQTCCGEGQRANISGFLSHRTSAAASPLPLQCESSHKQHIKLRVAVFLQDFMYGNSQPAGFHWMGVVCEPLVQVTVFRENGHCVMKYIVYFSQFPVKVNGQAWDKDKKYLDKNTWGFESSDPIIIENKDVFLPITVLNPNLKLYSCYKTMFHRVIVLP